MAGRQGRESPATKVGRIETGVRSLSVDRAASCPRWPSSVASLMYTSIMLRYSDIPMISKAFVVSRVGHCDGTRFDVPRSKIDASVVRIAGTRKTQKRVFQCALHRRDPFRCLISFCFLHPLRPTPFDRVVNARVELPRWIADAFGIRWMGWDRLGNFGSRRISYVVV